MVFANVVRFVRQSKRILRSGRVGLTIRDCPRAPISSAVEMGKPKVLVTQLNIPDECLYLLKERYRCDVTVWHEAGPIPRSKLLSMITGVDALLCMPTDEINEKVLQAAGPQLKVVASMSETVDHLDIENLKKRNIKIGYTPNVLTESTVELVIGLLLATARKFMQALSFNHDDQWPMCGVGLAGKTVGIVGLGRIGLRVGETLKSFNVAKILYTSRTAKSEASKFDGEKVDFLVLLRNSDIVIATVALTPVTKHMFTGCIFDQMKNTAIFVNVSHEDVVDMNALIKALNTNVIAAAGLHITTSKPPVELLELNNCLVLNQIAGATVETRTKMTHMTMTNIMAVLDGKPTEMAAEYV